MTKIKDLQQCVMVKAFQNDLQNGLSIEECCNKHNVTLEYAFKVIHKWQMKQNKKQKRTRKQEKYPTVESNIQRNHGYMVRKTINGKQQYFGRYKTLTEARQVKAYLEKHGWTQENLKRVKEMIQ